MVRIVAATAALLAAAGLPGCATDDRLAPTAAAPSVAVGYGTIERVSMVRLDQARDAEDGIVGGLLGMAPAGGDLLAYALDGSDRVDRYLIRREDGSTLGVTTEPRDLEVGDCVAIEQDRHPTLRRVAVQYCEPETSVLADPRVAQQARRDAQVCQEAKEALLQARGGATTREDAAIVQALCNG